MMVKVDACYGSKEYMFDVLDVYAQIKRWLTDADSENSVIEIDSFSPFLKRFKDLSALNQWAHSFNNPEELQKKIAEELMNGFINRNVFSKYGEKEFVLFFKEFLMENSAKTYTYTYLQENKEVTLSWNENEGFITIITSDGEERVIDLNAKEMQDNEVAEMENQENEIFIAISLDWSFSLSGAPKRIVIEYLLKKDNLDISKLSQKNDNSWAVDGGEFYDDLKNLFFEQESLVCKVVQKLLQQSDLQFRKKLFKRCTEIYEFLSNPLIKQVEKIQKIIESLENDQKSVQMLIEGSEE